MNKKVLFISSMYPSIQYPQDCIFVHELAASLKIIGVDVDVVVPVTMYNKEYYPSEIIKDNVNIKFIRYFKLPKTSYLSGRMLYWSLIKKINFSNYDMIHVHNGIPEGLAAMLISKKKNIPYLVHVHTLDVYYQSSIKEIFSKNQIKRNIKKIYEKASMVVCVSKKVENNILNVQSNKVISSVVYNGVDVNKFYPIEKKQSDVLTIISVGNLIDIKGHEFVIRAIDVVRKSVSKKIKLKIIGRGKNEKKLKELVTILNLEDFVEFCGFVKYDVVASELRNADVFILASYYDALGCVYLESMASGLPTLAGRGCGIDEIIIDKQNGLLIEPKNVEDISNKLIEIINNDGLREKVSATGLKTINKEYTWINIAIQLEKIYDSLSPRKQ